MKDDPWARKETAVFSDEKSTTKKPGPKPNIVKRNMSGFRVTETEKQIINDIHMLILNEDPTLVKGQSIPAALIIFSHMLKKEPLKTKNLLKEIIEINDHINIKSAETRINKDKQGY